MHWPGPCRDLSKGNTKHASSTGHFTWWNPFNNAQEGSKLCKVVGEGVSESVGRDYCCVGLHMTSFDCMEARLNMFRFPAISLIRAH